MATEPKSAPKKPTEVKPGEEEWRKKYPQLRTFRDMDPEERRALQVKGGKATAATRHRRRMIKDLMNDVLSNGVEDKEILERLSALGYEPSNQMLVAFQTVMKAATGDIEAARFVRDTIGEKPAEGVNVSITDPSKLTQYDMNRLSDEQLIALATEATEKEEEK